MVILGIDPGIASTGYCIGKDNEILDYGVIRTYTNKSDFERCKEITKKLEELIKKYNVGKVIIEDYWVYNKDEFSVGKSRGEKAIQVITHIQLLCEKLEIDWELVAHNKWKADFKRVWNLIVMASIKNEKMKKLKDLYIKLSEKSQDHELDAFRIVLPRIISLRG